MWYKKKYPRSKAFRCILDGSSVRRITLGKCNVEFCDVMDVNGGTASLREFCDTLGLELSKSHFPHHLNVDAEFLERPLLPSDQESWRNPMNGETLPVETINAVLRDQQEKGLNVGGYLEYYVRRYHISLLFLCTAKKGRRTDGRTDVVFDLADSEEERERIRPAVCPSVRPPVPRASPRISISFQLKIDTVICAAAVRKFLGILADNFDNHHMCDVGLMTISSYSSNMLQQYLVTQKAAAFQFPDIASVYGPLKNRWDLTDDTNGRHSLSLSLFSL